jgi:pimeloyl-ACP methyl ester carboxylesterase
MQTRFVLVLLFNLILLLRPSIAAAETPILESNTPQGDYGGFDQAQFVPDAHFMWFVMGQLQTNDDIDVVTFDYRAGEMMRGIIFIPVNDDLHNFSPHVALVGPGLPKPAEPLPFEIPEGMGAIVGRSNSNETYFDIFTQINFYPRAMVEAVAPQSTRYYMVVFGDRAGSSRYALDIGIMETYAPAVLARYPINWWEVRDMMRWGHWPAILYALAAAIALQWLLRRGALARRTSDLARSVIAIISFFIIAMITIAVILQEDSVRSFVITPTGMLVTLLGLALGGSGFAGMFLLTPVRERSTLPEVSQVLTDGGRFATVDGVSLHYTDEGSPAGRTVVLLHGFSSSVFTWRDVRAALVDAGFRVVAIDLLGCGASARSTNAAAYTTQAQARLILGALDEIGITRADFIGHSFGGRLAMQIGIIAPQRVRSLALIAPEAFATARPTIARFVSLPVIGYALTFVATSPLFVRSGLSYVSHSKDWIYKESVRGYAAPLHGRGTIQAQIAQSRAPKDEAELPVPGNAACISAPTLLLWGERDPIFPPSHGEKLAAAIPNAALTVVTAAGHVLHEEKPAEVCDALIAWLRRNA